MNFYSVFSLPIRRKFMRKTIAGIIKKEITSVNVKRLLLTTIAINLILILVVFAGPRIKFIAENFDKSYAQLAATSGPSDLPNQFHPLIQKNLK